MWLCAIFFFDPHNTCKLSVEKKIPFKEQTRYCCFGFPTGVTEENDMAVAQRYTIKSWPIQGNHWVMVAYG